MTADAEDFGEGGADHQNEEQDELPPPPWANVVLETEEERFYGGGWGHIFGGTACRARTDSLD